MNRQIYYIKNIYFTIPLSLLTYLLFRPVVILNVSLLSPMSLTHSVTTRLISHHTHFPHHYRTTVPDNRPYLITVQYMLSMPYVSSLTTLTHPCLTTNSAVLHFVLKLQLPCPVSPQQHKLKENHATE